MKSREDAAAKIETVREAKLYRGLIKLSIRYGDILDEDANAIVNSSNMTMQHTEGLSANIVRQGGAIIQQESDMMMAKIFGYNMVPPGKCVLTSAGRLPFNHIIHTVGPVYADGGQIKND